MSLRKSAIVIGAGVVGVATAYALARRGVRVTLTDRHAGPGYGTSFANGAQLSYVYTDALASPRLLKDIPRLALGLDPAFRLRLSLDPAFLSWIAQFLGNCTASRFRANTLSALKLGLESRAAMAALMERHDLSFGHDVKGKIQVYRSPAAFEAACGVMALKREEGVEQLALSPDEAAALEPALAQGRAGIVGVIYTPAEAVGDAFRFTQSLHQVLEVEYGVNSHFGFNVERIALVHQGAQVIARSGETLTADMAVVCTGAQAARLLGPHGIRATVWPMKGYSFTAPLGGNPPQVSITDTSRRVVFTRLGEQIRVAGFAELGVRSADVPMGRMEDLLKAARSALPDAADYDRAEQHWAGLRPMTPDSLPRIGHPHPALAYNVGHGMLGWTMALGTAERLAQLATSH